MMTDQELNKGLLTLKIIWSAMLMSLAVYLFVGLQIAANVQSSMTDETFGVLKTVLYIIALDYLDRHQICKKDDSVPKRAKQTAVSGCPSSRASDVYDRHDLGPGYVGKHRYFWTCPVFPREEYHGSVSADTGFCRCHVHVSPQQGRAAHLVPRDAREFHHRPNDRLTSVLLVGRRSINFARTFYWSQ